MGRMKTARKSGMEMCPGCTKEARLNDESE